MSLGYSVCGFSEINNILSQLFEIINPLWEPKHEQTT